MEKNFYQATTLALVVLLLFTVVVYNNNYVDLLMVNETLTETNKALEEDTKQLKETLNDNRIAYNSNLEHLQEELTNYKSLYYDLYEKYGQVVEDGRYFISMRELDLLVKCVETEAGVNNRESQRYITQVIINRVMSSDFPNSIEDVIYQKSNGIPQFSVAYNGAMNKCNPSSETYVNVLTALLMGTDLPEYVCYFHSVSVKKNWINSLNTYTVLQGTVFAYDERSKNNEQE